MEIIKIRTLWPEKKGFNLERENIGDEYIFIHFHTPVRILTDNGYVTTSRNSFIIQDKFSHQKFDSAECDLIHDWMHIKGNLDDIIKKAELRYNTIYEIADGKSLTNHWRDIELETIQKKPFYDIVIDKKLELLFLTAGRISKSSHTNADSRLYKKLLETRSTIHKNYYKDWTVEKMASLLPISPSRFYDLYKEFFGISPKKDLQTVRIEHAINLLKNNISVKECAEQIGYKNEYYFIRKFKEITGQTPGHYK